MLNSEQILELYNKERKEEDIEEEQRLRKVYLGENLKNFDWKPDESWDISLQCGFREKTDLNKFYVQGMESSVSITEEGLKIETLQSHQPMGYKNDEEDKNQMYLWTEDVFEGDLYVSFEFKSLKKGGLALLMTQASGMQREDFMADYPRRTDGAMRMVCWEDVRNYHWEFYREMNDTRNDVATHAMLKNPYFWPIGFQCMPELLSDEKWHRIEFLQEGAHIRGIVDNIVVIDTYDNSFVHNGGIYNFGRVAIRCMIRTILMVRDLEVRTRPRFKVR